MKHIQKRFAEVISCWASPVSCWDEVDDTFALCALASFFFFGEAKDAPPLCLWCKISQHNVNMLSKGETACGSPSEKTFPIQSHSV